VCRPGRRTDSRSWRKLRWKSRRTFAGAEYEATPDEMAAIDEGLSGDDASEKKSTRPSPCSGRNDGRIFEAGPRRSSTNCRLLRSVRYSAIANRIVERVQQVIAQIAISPLSGRAVVGRPGVRLALFRSYRYKIFYGSPQTPSRQCTSATRPD